MDKSRVSVVGAGAAGLMATGQAAEMGAEVVLLEKMARLGLKLNITGKGRCNLTNIAPLPEFIEHFGQNGTFLRQAFSRFFTEDLIAFFKELGIETVSERGGRVFPASDRALELTGVLGNWVIGRARIKTNCTVKNLLIENKRVVGVTAQIKSSDWEDFRADRVIIATGGKSYPGTGSTGDGYELAKAVGHTIVPARPALVPLKTKGNIAGRLQGLSLKNVNVKVIINGKKHAEAFGEMLFTHFGVSGPIILSLSKLCVDALLAREKVVISIDLKPALDDQQLDQRILRDLNQHGKRQFQNIIKLLLPQKLIPICVELTSIDPEKSGNQIGSEERKRLRLWLKDFQLDVTGHRPFSEAIITAGGVDLKEVNPRTMESRLINGLYFAGEVLDIDADTGGYNLQAAFSMGWLAGRSAAKE
jgi:predicted Rossmann fold flavoprotein